MPDPTLPEGLRQRLALLTLKPRKIRASGQKGERRSAQRGTSIEFADFRNYVAGDDLRKLDWNAYARLNRPVVKLYEDEQDLMVHVLLDDSASMGTLDDESNQRKQQSARQIAAGLGFIALNVGDRLTVTRLSQPQEPLYSGRGRASIVAMMRTLAEVTATHQVDLVAALRQFAQRERRGGMVFIISDLFTEGDLDDGIKALLATNHEITVLHTLTTEELEPTLTGDLRLIDVESGDARDLTINADLYAQYRRTLEDWLKQTRALCARRGVNYLQVNTDQPLDALFLRELRRIGVVG